MRVRVTLGESVGMLRCSVGTLRGSGLISGWPGGTLEGLGVTSGGSEGTLGGSGVLWEGQGSLWNRHFGGIRGNFEEGVGYLLGSRVTLGVSGGTLGWSGVTLVAL